MKMGRLIHQQVMQLRWHVLACFGLVMVLPIEEGLINLKDGHGFYASALSLGLPLTAAPLLAGLIACGNVQADLDDRRYLFWRARPVSVTGFMAIKFAVGLILSLLVIASPVVFMWATGGMADARRTEHGFDAYMINAFLISIMAYSLCFLCNVLIRKTARAWLVGMALMCLTMLMPFMLPLQMKDVRSDFLAVVTAIFVSIILGAALIGAILSLVAAARNWHLKTNLKGLLWAAASVVFLLLLLVSRQVANIKELDEKVVYNPINGIKNIDGRLLLQCQPKQPLASSPDKQVYENYYIAAENGQIRFMPIENKKLRDRLFIYVPEMPTYEKDGHEYSNHAIGDFELMANEHGLFIYSVYVDTRREKPERKRQLYGYAYLRCYQLNNSKPKLVSEVDLSEFLEDSGLYPRCLMRRLGDKIAVIVNKSAIVVKLAKDGQFKVIEEKPGKINRWSYQFNSQVDTMGIPRIPLETLDEDEIIRLSVDLITYYDYNSRLFFSRVDKRDGQYVFAMCSQNAILRYDITKWDNEKIECRLRDYRSFTLLERALGDTWYFDFKNFVRDGKLYTYDRHSLMVFDIRSDRIRKLGHYFQPGAIEDIKVLDDGNILLLLSEYRHKNWKPAIDRLEHWGTLQLLENPQ